MSLTSDSGLISSGVSVMSVPFTVTDLSIHVDGNCIGLMTTRPFAPTILKLPSGFTRPGRLPIIGWKRRGWAITVKPSVASRPLLPSAATIWPLRVAPLPVARWRPETSSLPTVSGMLAVSGSPSVPNGGTVAINV